MAGSTINLKNIKTEVDKVESIKTETAIIKAETDKITNIEKKVGEMETKIKELEGFVGKQDTGGDHSKDTGIYKAIYDGFNDLIGES